MASIDDELDSGDKAQPVTDKGGFFGVSIKTVGKMVNAGAGAEELMAYMVLSRGVNVRGSKRISTHGANSISTRTGMSYRTAEAALDTVEQIGIAHKAGDKTDAASPKKHHARWILQDEPIDVYLANSLTDGIGQGKQNPPLMRIYNQVSLGTNGLMSDARLDAVMVLVHLYLHQDMQGCGGVNPRVGIYREWTAAHSWGAADEDIADGRASSVTDIEGTNAALYEIEGGNNVMFTKFAAEALFYVADADERNSRFWSAFHNLRRLGFLYEVTQVWSGNPNGTNGKKAEPLYTLYIHDRHAREAEPYLQTDIHKAAFRTGAMDRMTEFADEFNESGESNILFTDRFRFIAAKKVGGFPIGIYRLRFRPKTRDVGLGIEAEQHRVAQWAATLKNLH